MRKIISTLMLAILLVIIQPILSVVGQLPSYYLTIDSLPIEGVEFHIDDFTYSTPWSGFLPQGNYTLAMPSNWMYQGTTYRFASWEDGSTDPSRSINLNRNMTIQAQYELITHRLTVNTSPQSIQFTVDGIVRTSPWSDMLPEGNHTVAMPASVVLDDWSYIFSVWEDSSTNPRRTLSLTSDLTIHASFRLKEVVDVSGDQTVKVILVEFLGLPHSVSDDAIKARLNLVQAYFQNASYGFLRLRFDLLPMWLTVGKSMTYYGAGNFTRERHEGLATDSIQAASPYADFTTSKRVLIVHSGADEARSHNQSDIWSFASSGPTDYSTSKGTVRLFTAVVSELDPLGMFAHEVGHMLGLPDLYNITVNLTGEEDNFVGPWDLMGEGSWNFRGDHPSYLCSWSMMYLGWMPSYQVAYVELKQMRTVTIDGLEALSSGLHSIVIPLGAQKFYVIEARVDSHLPQQGIVVYYVDNATLGILVKDAITSTRTLSDAAYQFMPGRIPAFVDDQYDVAVIVLNNQRNQYRLLIGEATIGYEALTAANSIYSLITAIQDTESKTGLTLRSARAELEKALTSYDLAAFNKAKECAQTGIKAKDEELKLIAQQYIDKAENQLNETSMQAILWGRISPDLSEPQEILLRAKQEYTKGNFVQALQIITQEFEPAIQRSKLAYQQKIRNIVNVEFIAIIALAVFVAAIFIIRSRSDRYHRGK